MFHDTMILLLSLSRWDDFNSKKSEVICFIVKRGQLRMKVLAVRHTASMTLAAIANYDFMLLEPFHTKL